MEAVEPGEAADGFALPGSLSVREVLSALAGRGPRCRDDPGRGRRRVGADHAGGHPGAERGRGCPELPLPSSRPKRSGEPDPFRNRSGMDPGSARLCRLSGMTDSFSSHRFRLSPAGGSRRHPPQRPPPPARDSFAARRRRSPRAAAGRGSRMPHRLARPPAAPPATARRAPPRRRPSDQQRHRARRRRFDDAQRAAVCGSAASSRSQK